ncbi:MULTISPECIES: DNA/RNA non-specific endonuclease [unclassified Ruegeria]|uniref:DNA/RNA non-specific endonuclease n=1 Tax=unclassified Ruegeria TaxID=2625375 RepID=UPI0014876EA9|nr:MULTISPECIES: DNA/RNA non-specific endonuclease [unclassified Ruegeria]
MAIPNKFTSSRRSDVVFEGEKFSTGADEVTCILTTDSLKLKGSSPASGHCAIVERFNARWDVKDLIDLGAVQKALSNKSTLQKLARANSVEKILELLALSEIHMMADYSELQAQTYIKGHILSEKLGGPGTNANLTPMSASSNSTYYSGFESKLIKKLQEIRKEEKASGYRARVRFHAKCKGSMKPWWGGASKETVRMLSKLPRTLEASWRLDSFFPDGKPNERLAKSQLPADASKKMPKTLATKAESYTLAL